MSNLSFILILLISLSFSNAKDISTFSNYKIIRQTRIEANLDIDFDQKVIHGTVKTYFTALEDGEVVVLDTRALKINSVIDSDTGDELEYILDEQYELDCNGVPLKIYKDYNKGDEIAILIKYDTTDSGSSVQFLNPEQTTGKIYPFMFTQCETILCRELLPTQDTPDVKITVGVGLTVIKPLFALNSGIYQSQIDNGDTVTYFYEQKVPIPSYLIAIAAGAIEERVISDRTKVYGEKEVVDLAAYEFEDTENFIQIAEAYLIPYEWGEYNLLVLPSSFPYGGMENPTLTFVTPSLIAGDKSLANVIAHEISHSWSGNLVTMDNWSNFWLNEGFTMFIQRKIMEKSIDLDMAKLDAMLIYNDMCTDIINFGESKSFSSLHPYLVGRHPDDSFSTIPYEKGFNFLYYLEGLVNAKVEIDLFRKILRNYFTTFKYKSIKYEEFRDFFIKTLIEEIGEEEAQKILDKVDWVKWIEAPGFPPIKNDFSNKYATEVENAVGNFYNNTLPSDFNETFTKWHTLLKQYFLSSISETDRELDDTQLNYLSKVLDLKEGYNAEVNFGYFMVVLQHGKIIEEDVEEALIAFLGKFGRLKYLRPLYMAFAKRDKETAKATFEKYKSSYHPIAQRLIELDFKKLG